MALTYSRILNSRSRREIVDLGHSRGSVRRSPYQSMRWIPVEEPVLRVKALSEWWRLAQRRKKSIFQMATEIDRLTALVPRISTEVSVLFALDYRPVRPAAKPVSGCECPQISRY